MHSISLKKRIIPTLIVVWLTIFLAGVFFVNSMGQEHKRRDVLQDASAMRSHLQSILDNKAEMMGASLRFIVQDRQLVEALRGGDRQRLLALGAPIYERLHQEHNITHFYFHDARRVNLVRIHMPDRYGDTIDRFTALGAEKSASLFSGIELGPLGTFTLRSVLPVFDGAQLLGYIELGQEIDALLQEARAMFHSEMLVLIDKRYLGRDDWEAGQRMLGRGFDWDALSTTVLVSESLPGISVELLNDIAGQRATTDIRIGPEIQLQDKRFWSGIIPMDDVGGRPVATLIMLRDVTKLIDDARTTLLMFAAISALTGLVVLTIFYLVLDQAEQAQARAQKMLLSEGQAREALITQALNIQRALDTMLHLPLPSLSLTEVLVKSLDAILSIQAFSLLQTGSIFLTGKDGKTLELVAQKNLPDALLQLCAKVPFGKCLCGKAASSREVIYCNHLNEAHEIGYKGMPPHGHYCLPIMLEGQVLGVLNTYVADGHVTDVTERKYLETVADTLAVVIERKQSGARLEQLAHNDNLTGLPNRALFYDRLEQRLALAQRNQQQFAVMFLDLDHFKEVNDTYGHDIGDLLLREAAVRLLGCVRKADTVARMGGDEFTVILIEMKTLAGVEYVAKNILKAMQQPFEFNGVTCSIGCSIGIALYPAHGMDSETLLKNADLAMYCAKRQRNIFYIFKDDLL